MPNMAINLIGFSLGTHLITFCLEELIKIGREHVIKDVLFLGGVADID